MVVAEQLGAQKPEQRNQEIERDSRTSSPKLSVTEIPLPDVQAAKCKQLDSHCQLLLGLYWIIGAILG